MQTLKEKILNGIYPLTFEDYSLWSQNSLVQKHFREASMFYFKRINHALEYKGKGIVTCGGGKLWPSLYVCVRAIRYHECNLPIQIWYLGDQEFDLKFMNCFKNLNVEFIDAIEHAKKNNHSRVLSNADLCFKKNKNNSFIGGWMLKPYSILFSCYNDVLFLDADNTPTKNPEYLFLSSFYKKNGAYFFPDKYHEEKEDNFKLSQKNCDIFGIKYTKDISFDSGVMLIDKSKCLKQLFLTLWWNEFPEFTYNILHGDKDTFALSWAQTNKEYYLVETNPISGHGLQQFDHEGNIAFLHRCGAKWNLKQNVWLNRPQESILHGFIDDLNKNLKKRIFL